ncbi:hypothetical protein A3H38_00485 [candidate division WOR-1 bacterium RIFCSPLOWO2_02_FULL_46_20]|uniref:RNA-binding protein n=2 Tax=Saganbacteria TaxID=1703751 RepID=A0A1F4RHN8_UNCSA|nr:MAG: hypothetical protein A3J44_06490 [candidate division WOR-1 bacterium RIFCSPHIGHO2_02_FULL_45_12]OGC06993.1 MAG: hypothetical protein A3H38_00485 [candidate division WOR-1 bacterium RIFCSPLOWO2_02_FULL_46_20]OGC09488.1 MAG: hypothetical protein A3F86_02600 [candidate division WOR-1 bacterium RIFCSPLOWO2_12_FULL_45_9]
MAKKLADIFDGMELGLGRTIKLCNLLTLWQSVVDDRVGKRTEAVKIRNKTLYISTSSPTWAQELSFLKKEIVEKFNDKAGKEVICDIKFSCGG